MRCGLPKPVTIIMARQQEQPEFAKPGLRPAFGELS